jgi:H+-translocating NAD(P) transhydrogenase subunit alpha
MNASDFQDKMNALTVQMSALTQQMAQLTAEASQQMSELATRAPQIVHSGNFFVDALTVLILAGFVGYYVIWNVTPALHAPLMGITNAISSVIIVGALIAAGPAQSSFSKWLGFAGIVLASINIFGGFVVTNRMLEMFTSKKKKAAPTA